MYLFIVDVLHFPVFHWFLLDSQPIVSIILIYEITLRVLLMKKNEQYPLNCSCLILKLRKGYKLMLCMGFLTKGVVLTHFIRVFVWINRELNEMESSFVIYSCLLSSYLRLTSIDTSHYLHFVISISLA